ncbi:acyl-CoA carboxylase subunit epsilon [Spirillospora sp. NPDC029432]|uniref:acyl-CoA carboxylase subunit epsilon n=1 Tax=Spirillospora sp. NPDC029432 TaxID=3154599 RepID=UPI0034566E4E
MSQEGAAGGDRPFLQIVRGDATPEEVAALVAVLTAQARAAAGGGGRGEPDVSRWADPSRLVRDPAGAAVRPRGPRAWRASALPR